MEQSGRLALLKLQVTHTPFLGITISIDQVIIEKESIFKVCIILPYTQNHTVLQRREYKQSLAVPKQVLIMIPLEGRILKEFRVLNHITNGFLGLEL